MKNKIELTEKPTIVEVFSDNGAHSHWTLIDTNNGIKLWSEDPEECKAMGYPVSSQQEPIKGLEELISDEAIEMEGNTNNILNRSNERVAFKKGARWLKGLILPHLRTSTQSDAVEFANYIAEGNLYFDDKWNTENGSLTTEELYTEFQNSKGIK